jgi:4-carboxymuconolactone decarboxylase
MARVEQLTEKSQLAAEFHPLYDRIAKARGQVGGPYSILLHSPVVADRVDALSQALRACQLTPTEFVLIALSVSRTRDCRFVWSVQAPAARRAGVSDAVISAIGARQTAALDAEQADIVEYVRQTITAPLVDQVLFDRLRARHGDQWLVELTTTAGHFNLICGINNAFDVAPLPEGDALPS